MFDLLTRLYPLVSSSHLGSFQSLDVVRVSVLDNVLLLVTGSE